MAAAGATPKVAKIRARPRRPRRPSSLDHAVGSTSIPGLCAKPLIDIVLAVADSADEASYVPALTAQGYTLHLRETGREALALRVMKGDLPPVNLHVFTVGSVEIARMRQQPSATAVATTPTSAGSMRWPNGRTRRPHLAARATLRQRQGNDLSVEAYHRPGHGVPDLKEAAMPARETVEAFVAMVEAGRYVDAIEQFYAPDAAMQENGEPPRVGRETLMEGERRVMARFQSIAARRIGASPIDGDHVRLSTGASSSLPRGGRTHDARGDRLAALGRRKGRRRRASTTDPETARALIL